MRESERRFRVLLENLGLAALSLDTAGRITFCNPHLVRLVGHASADEMLGLDWFEHFLPPGVGPRLREIFAEGVRTDAVPPHFENEIRTRHGELRLLRWSNMMLLAAAGRPEGVVSIGEDVTEQARAEEGRRLALAAVDSSQIAMAFADMRGRLTYVNQAFLRLWGPPRLEEAVGRPIWEFWVDREAADAAARAVSSEGRWAGQLVQGRSSNPRFESGKLPYDN